MVGICGVGGIGKTTIAKAVFNLIADQFEGSSFLVNVRDTSRRYSLARLQQALLSDMLGDPDVRVGYSLTGVKIIQERLHDKRVLLVLDDVDTLGILRDLLGDGVWFGSGSRIIITARKEEALIGHCVEIYKVEQLNYDDALQLFCWNAFQTSSPARDYELLCISFMSCVNRIPLFLIVLGSCLKAKSTEEWHRAFSRLKELVDEGKGDAAVRISLESLETHERNIFLDIACLFKGEDKDYVIKQWDRCNFYPDSGLAILVERSLISIESNKIWMHNVIQELGQDIVRAESSDDPSRCSRLWCLEDVLQALKANSDIGNSYTEGIRLDTVDPGDLLMIMKAIKKKKMKKLRVFIAQDIQISRCPEYLSKQFSWPDTHGIELAVIAETAGFSASWRCSNESTQCDSDENDLSDTAENSNQVRSTISLYFKPIKVASRKLFSKLRSRRMKQGGCGHEWEDLTRFKRFSLKELCKATNSFSKLLGIGGQSHVYFGRLVNGQSVVVKKMSVSADGCYSERTFVNECRVLSGVNHKNLVSLIGFLAENDYDRALVFEYFPNGSLYDHLHGSSFQPTDLGLRIMLSWQGRLKVALDIARGVEYLHAYADPRVIHHSLQPKNILLDVDFTAKLYDFGLAKFDSHTDEDSWLCGYFGYTAPEYFEYGACSTKSDVYSFGVVLLELLSGLRANTLDENGAYTTHVTVLAANYIKDGAMDKIMDPKIPENNPQEMEAVRDIILLAADCTKLKPTDRPSMTEVVHCLSTGLMKCTTTLVTSTSQSSPVSLHRDESDDDTDHDGSSPISPC